MKKVHRQPLLKNEQKTSKKNRKKGACLHAEGWRSRRERTFPSNTNRVTWEYEKRAFSFFGDFFVQNKLLCLRERERSEGEREVCLHVVPSLPSTPLRHPFPGGSGEECTTPETLSYQDVQVFFLLLFFFFFPLFIFL